MDVTTMQIFLTSLVGMFVFRITTEVDPTPISGLGLVVSFGTAVYTAFQLIWL